MRPKTWLFGRRQVRDLARHGAVAPAKPETTAEDVCWEIHEGRIVAKEVSGPQPERRWVATSSTADSAEGERLEDGLRKAKTRVVSMTTSELDALIRKKVDEAFTKLTPEDRALLIKSAERRQAEAGLTPSQRLDGHAARETGGEAEGLLVAHRDGGVPTRAGMAAPKSRRASMRSVVDQPTALPDGSFEQ